jgi:hypothetical protein
VHEQFLLAVYTTGAVFVLAHRRIWKLSLEPGLGDGETMDSAVLHDEIAAVRNRPRQFLACTD